MDKIYKKISLEQFKSRSPGLIPALVEYDIDTYADRFTYEVKPDRSDFLCNKNTSVQIETETNRIAGKWGLNEKNGNWGLIVSDIDFSLVGGELSELGILSYRTIIDRYNWIWRFFKNSIYYKYIINCDGNGEWVLLEINDNRTYREIEFDAVLPENGTSGQIMGINDEIDVEYYGFNGVTWIKTYQTPTNNVVDTVDELPVTTEINNIYQVTNPFPRTYQKYGGSTFYDFVNDSFAKIQVPSEIYNRVESIKVPGYIYGVEIDEWYEWMRSNEKSKDCCIQQEYVAKGGILDPENEGYDDPEKNMLRFLEKNIDFDNEIEQKYRTFIVDPRINSDNNVVGQAYAVITFNINTNDKIMGEYTNAVDNWTPGREYFFGDIVVYNNETYVLYNGPKSEDGGMGYAGYFDPIYYEIYFDDIDENGDFVIDENGNLTHWMLYTMNTCFDRESETWQTIVENNDNLPQLTASIESRLTSVKRLKNSYDDDGTKLPGILSSDGATMELEYIELTPYNVEEIIPIGAELDENDEPMPVYYGDIIGKPLHYLDDDVWGIYWFKLHLYNADNYEWERLDSDYEYSLYDITPKDNDGNIIVEYTHEDLPKPERQKTYYQFVIDETNPNDNGRWVIISKPPEGTVINEYETINDRPETADNGVVCLVYGEWNMVDGTIGKSGEGINFFIDDSGKQMVRFTYYIGAEINMKETEDESKYEVTGVTGGIKFQETYPYTDEIITLNNGKKIPYQNIDFMSQSTPITNSELDNTSRYVIIADATYEGDWLGKTNKLDNSTNSNKNYVFREEYKLGMTANPKMDINVNIDRGVNAAFERHLKLTECFTLDALERYSNGSFFKIMNN